MNERYQKVKRTHTFLWISQTLFLKSLRSQRLCGEIDLFSVDSFVQFGLFVHIRVFLCSKFVRLDSQYFEPYRFFQYQMQNSRKSLREFRFHSKLLNKFRGRQFLSLYGSGQILCH